MRNTICVAIAAMRKTSSSTELESWLAEAADHARSLEVGVESRLDTPWGIWTPIPRGYLAGSSALAARRSGCRIAGLARHEVCAHTKCVKILSRYAATVPHPPHAVFERWADPTTWPEWDPEVERVDFAGPLAVGATGRLTPRSGPSARFAVTEVVPDRVLSDAAALPGARLEFIHRVAPHERGSAIEVVVGVSGPLSGPWARFLRRSMAGAAEASGRGLLEHLEARRGERAR